MLNQRHQQICARLGAHRRFAGAGSVGQSKRLLSFCAKRSLCMSAVACSLGLLSASAAAAECPAGSAATNCAPGWALTSQAYPTNLPPGGDGFIRLDVLNVGEGASSGPVTVTDTLPTGVVATDAGLLGIGENVSIIHSLWDCTGIGTSVVTCTNDPTTMPHLAAGAAVPNGLPNPDPGIGIAVKVTGGPGVGSNHVTIAGGGAPTASSIEAPVTISATPAQPGVTGWDAWFSNADGTLDTQAGSHPYEATFSLDFANEQGEFNLLGPFRPARGREVRNIEAPLPPGFVGDPNAVPQCTQQQFVGEGKSNCPEDTQIGILQVLVAGGQGFRSQVFNMVPPAGVPAEFAAYIEGTITLFDATVRSGGDYGITEHIDNIVRKNLISSVLTLWGVPADPSHDPFRTRKEGGCEGAQFFNECKPSGAPLKPFLTLPTSCGKAQPFSISANTWQEPNTFFGASVLTHDANGGETGFTGCENLAFGPSLSTEPDTAKADTPAGLTVDVKAPLGGLQEEGQLGTSDIKATTVTLPPGFVINPGQAAGLQACQPGQDGLTSAQEEREGRENDGPPSCPNASKVGTVRAKSPLIEAAAEKELEGNVYVMQSNPPNLKLLMAFSADGVNIKLVLHVDLDESTGQVTTTVDGIPELPASDFKLSFSGGPQAALDTPTQCGSYTTTSDFTPWSSPFIAHAFPTAQFSLTEGPNGGACPSNPMPFAPSMTAGSTTDQAGSFTNFSLLLQRADGQQRIEKLQFREPAGLAGLISSVPLCDEADANAGTCPAVSHIGHAVVASGPGPYPLVLPQPGAPELPIYLTGPYKGAPFGLSIVTPVIAGPFNLGTVITRAKIEVDPHTAQITVTTDPLPQIVDGVPTDLRSINSIIDRPGFLFNPTNCNPQEFTGTATSSQGTTAAISSHFGMGSCRSLAFKPKFSASASGKNSKAGGASLDVKVAYPSEPQGSEANIAKVKVDLPKQLPSRLTTLQKACTAAQFNANPAGCPAASVVGHAIVHTSVLPVPLEGPAYFVSNGGEAFPNLIMVLQGYGVTVDLVGDTFINKQGITSSTFKSVPDVPFNTFELMLPQGSTSALATDVPAKAQYSLCGQKLTMPTELIAQNGATIDQSTPIAINGCAKKKSLTRAQKLAAALKACHKKQNKAKRAACERTARKKYGPLPKTKKKK
jgi:hypothetical protein